MDYPQINTSSPKNIVRKSVIIFIGIIFLSLGITFGIHKYNQSKRNIQTPFFTSPYISLFVEILSTLVLLSAGIYLLINY